MDLPLPFDDFKEYLRASPELPPELPQALRQYFFQAVGPLKGMNGTLTINQGLVPPAKPDHASVMLDIYLACDDGVPESSEGIWAIFDRTNAPVGEWIYVKTAHDPDEDTFSIAKLDC